MAELHRAMALAPTDEERRQLAKRGTELS